MGRLHTLHLRDGTVSDKRQQLLHYFQQSFDTYERLFATLATDEVFYKRPEPLRHPLIFYFGHTATFYINKLILAKLINDRVNPEFESLFAIGVDEMSWDDLNSDNYDWPAVERVREYRQQVRRLVSDLIATLDFSLPIEWDSPLWPVIMGIEHEGIHLETSSVLIRQLPLTYIDSCTSWLPESETGDAPANALLPVSGGIVECSKGLQSDYYGWDNEYGYQCDEVKPFSAAKYLVSNGEYLEFVLDGGYKNPYYWQTEGNKWREYSKARMPVFWREESGRFFYRAMTKELPLPLNWPVDVNYHEAKAFCNWKSAQTGKTIQLPTENEWLRLRDQAGVTAMLYDEGWNIALNGPASSVPVDTHSAGGFYDVVGNVWQWTETPIYPFDGFKVHPLYDDFTTPTFDNKHNLIKGGSWISTGNEAMRDSRYAFRRHFIQHAGFRYVESEVQIKVSDFDYESDTQISQYCEFHYGESYFEVANFAKASVDFCMQFMSDTPTRKALDLGCAVGRSAFEFAQYFDSVDAIDFSARFIKTAVAMQQRGEIRYTLIDEGELTSFKSRTLKELGLQNTATKVQFAQGDACNLKPQYQGYDLIFMGNLIDRVYEPQKLLASVTQRLNVGGILVIASPFTWLEEYTKREHWLGGFKESTGESLSSTDALDRVLEANFKRIAAPQDIPFVIRETKRKHQHTLSEFNVFQKVK